MKEVGVEMPEQTFIANLLGGLPEHYKSVIKTMDAAANGNLLTVDDVIGKLIQNEDTSLNSDGQSETAMVSYNNYRKNNKKPNGSNNNSNNNHGKNNGKNYVRKCFNCGSENHIKRDCKQGSSNNKAENSGNNNNSNKSSKARGAFINIVNFTKCENVDETQTWYIDSGASSHCVKDESILNDKVAGNFGEVCTANNERLAITSKGNAQIELPTADIEINNCLFTPALSFNLLSVHEMVQRDCSVVFEKSSGCTVYDKFKNVLLNVMPTNGIYAVEAITKKSTQGSVFVAKESNCEAAILHRKLGHTSYENMAKMNNKVKGIKFRGNKSDIRPCDVCMSSKMTNATFSSTTKRAEKRLELIHMDLIDMPCRSFGGAKYILCLVDDFTCEFFSYLLRGKTQEDVFKCFEEFKALVENKTDERIKSIRSDNGREFKNGLMEAFTKKAGIEHQFTVAYAHQQNGRAERWNRTLEEKIKALLFDSKLPKQAWGEAANHATYLMNRQICSVHGKIPHELMFNEKVDLSNLQIFGAKMMTFIPKEKRNKLMKHCDDTRVFVGFQGGSKNLRMLDPKLGNVIIVKKAMLKRESQVTSRDGNDEALDVGSNSVDDRMKVTVTSSSGSDGDESDESIESENESLSGESSDSSIDDGGSDYHPSEEESDDTLDDSNNPIDDSIINVEDESIYESGNNTFVDNPENDPDYDPRLNNILVVPKTKKKKAKKLRPFQFANLAILSDVETVLKCDSRCHDEDPQSLEEIMRRPDKAEWLDAIKSEYDSHLRNNTWTLVKKPKEAKIISSKMIYKTKFDSNGNAVRRKARLVARGFSQRAGIDYSETYAPVVKYTSIRVLMAIAAKRGLKVHQLDVTTAFLHGSLDEEIYIRQPEGHDDGTGRVCKLNKSIYGLKQAPKNWNKKLDETLKSFGLIQCKEDPCIYYSPSMKTIIAIYVDDFLIVYEDEIQFKKIKEVLMKSFDMKDLGPAKGCLGIRITLKKGKIELDQEIYLKEVLERFNMTDCNPISTPVQTDLKLVRESSEPEIDRSEIPYQEAIGCLLYLARGTRPDISYAVNLVSRFNNSYKQSHWIAVKRIMRYLKGTMTRRLQYTTGGLIGFVDADWGASCDKKSTTGYVFILAGAAISWKAQQQKTVATSSTTAELYAAYEAIAEGIWIKKLLVELREMGKNYVVSLFCDNSGVISTYKNKNFSNKLKNVEVKYHYIVSDEVKRDVNLKKIDTKINTADFFTKSVPAAKHFFCSTECGMTVVKF